jgi:hypothetical protein
VYENVVFLETDLGENPKIAKKTKFVEKTAGQKA